MWRKGTPCASLVGLQTSLAAMENSMAVSQERVERPQDPAIPLLDVQLKFAKKIKLKCRPHKKVNT